MEFWRIPKTLEDYKYFLKILKISGELTIVTRIPYVFWRILDKSDLILETQISMDQCRVRKHKYKI